jgi:hypothetical protein
VSRRKIPASHAAGSAKQSDPVSVVTRQFRSPYRLWQSGSFHHRIRGFESAKAKREYMLNNPVRAGLVSSPDEWPYRGELFLSERWW